MALAAEMGGRVRPAAAPRVREHHPGAGARRENLSKASWCCGAPPCAACPARRKRLAGGLAERRSAAYVEGIRGDDALELGGSSQARPSPPQHPALRLRAANLATIRCPRSRLASLRTLAPAAQRPLHPRSVRPLRILPLPPFPQSRSRPTWPPRPARHTHTLRRSPQGIFCVLMASVTPRSDGRRALWPRAGAGVESAAVRVLLPAV